MASPVKALPGVLCSGQRWGREGFAAFRIAQLPPYGFVEGENADKSSIIFQRKNATDRFFLRRYLLAPQ
jgi:hypothetical protein